MIQVNYLAVLVGAIVSMVLGFLWFGPVFGKKWMALAGINPDTSGNKSMAKSNSLMFVGALLMSYVLWNMIGYAIGFSQQSGAFMGVVGGFWIWLGFVAPVLMGKVIWDGKSWSLWIVEAGYYLVNLIVVGAILAAWM